MKNQLLIACLGLCLLTAFSGCSSDSEYETGYENAWQGSGKPNWFSSNKYKRGYELGLSDAYTYDDGYYDGLNSNNCAYPNDPDYMEGFINGKKNKR